MYFSGFSFKSTKMFEYTLSLIINYKRKEYILFANHKHNIHSKNFNKKHTHGQ